MANPYERDDQPQPGFEKTQLQPLRAAPMQLRLFMIGKVAAPKGGSNTTLAFNWAGDRSVEYASHPCVPPTHHVGFVTRTDQHRGSGPASVLRCQTTPFRSTIAVLYCPRFRSTGRGRFTGVAVRARQVRRRTPGTVPKPRIFSHFATCALL